MTSSETAVLFKKGEELKQKSRYQESLALFKKAFQGFRSCKDVGGMLECTLSIGDVYRMIGNFDAAEKSYIHAIDIATAMNDTVSLADAQAGLGLSLRGKGDWKNSLKMFGDALKCYRKNGDRHGIAFILWATAGALRIKGDIGMAIRTYHESLEIFRSLRFRSGTGYCLCGLGGTSRIAGLFDDSLRYYTDSNRLFAGIKDTFGLAYSYCGIGNAFRMLGEYKKAIASFDRASSLYQKIGDRVSYSYTLWSIGTTYKMLGEQEKAIYNFRTASRLFKKTKDPRGGVYCMLGLGEVAMIQGRKAVAERYFIASVNDARRYGFAVEKCHAEMLLACLSGKIKKDCYNKLGLKLQFTQAPFNLP